VGDSIIDKKTFCIQLLEALKKDGIKAAIFDSEKDFSNITNVDLILTRYHGNKRNNIACCRKLQIAVFIKKLPPLGK